MHLAEVLHIDRGDLRCAEKAGSQIVEISSLGWGAHDERLAIEVAYPGRIVADGKRVMLGRRQYEWLAHRARQPDATPVRGQPNQSGIRPAGCQGLHLDRCGHLAQSRSTSGIPAIARPTSRGKNA
jgi:hypothetical protein